MACAAELGEFAHPKRQVGSVLGCSGCAIWVAPKVPSEDQRVRAVSGVLRLERCSFFGRWPLKVRGA